MGERTGPIRHCRNGSIPEMPVRVEGKPFLTEHTDLFRRVSPPWVCRKMIGSPVRVPVVRTDRPGADA
ncbi:hypothetical protein [Nocardia sp. bgisy118]|uniref:hypothetical protein n=1 Tax=Nocardia sp. bgisy118 TaxID=3413786 RepID=UPI003F4A684A